MARTSGGALRKAQRGTLLRERRVATRKGSARRTQLDGGERLSIIDTFLTLLEGAYCHAPQKRAAYAVDPVQALQLFRRRAAQLSDAEFHLALTAVIQDLRDAHTQYSGPRSVQGKVAVLPFLVEQYGRFERPTFVVSKLSDRRLIANPKFREGVTLTTWNGIPFARALELHADRETGGRPDARRARALESLTFRSLEHGPPPDELWVDVGFRSERGARCEVRIPWRVVTPSRGRSAAAPGARAARFLALSPASEQVRRAKKLMFSGQVWRAERLRSQVAKGSDWLRTKLPDVLAARALHVRGHGVMGYLRVWSFSVDDEAFLAEVMRLLALLPQSGLIVDIRGNPGGLIWAAERMLQLFTPRRIEPVRFSLVATPLTRAMAESAFNRLELEPWSPSLEQALSTGELYSQPLPLTDPAWCNDLGQHYSGPVVCVADANTYSSGDLFAAGFVDNEVGPLLCVGEATGAGGANVWSSHDFREALSGLSCALPPAPDGVTFTMAIRRAVRSGKAAGVPIEDVGVAGIPYAMTRTDLLAENRHLLQACAKQLQGIERTVLNVVRQDLRLQIETRGLDQVECYVDGRPVEAAREIVDGSHTIELPAHGKVEVVGRRQGIVVQRRLLA